MSLFVSVLLSLIMSGGNDNHPDPEPPEPPRAETVLPSNKVFESINLLKATTASSVMVVLPCNRSSVIPMPMDEPYVIHYGTEATMIEISA